MIYKVKPTRVYRSYYGGKNLDKMSGKHTAENDRFPEDWLCSVTQAFNPGRNIKNEGLSVIDNGRYLVDVINENKREMLGDSEHMSLLFKLLDSAERLVIQVHPTNEFARKYFNSEFGKTESWYILNDGGYVYIGFKPHITKEYFVKLFNRQDISAMLECLHKFEVRKGDIIFVSGGVPHAIGAGCFLAELQEPTDLMVIPERITPSGIVLADEKLHGGLGFDKMFDCFCFEGLNRDETYTKYFKRPQQVNDNEKEIINTSMTDKFTLSEIEIKGSYVKSLNDYAIALVLTGEGKCNGISLKSYDRFFIPFNEKSLNFSGNMKVLLCQPYKIH